jgi:hypothetical protein
MSLMGSGISLNFDIESCHENLAKPLWLNCFGDFSN